jgi:hypothetical protein
VVIVVEYKTILISLFTDSKQFFTMFMFMIYIGGADQKFKIASNIVHSLSTGH